MKNEMLLGNCEDLMLLFPKNSIDLIVTDVPYGINYKSNRQGLDRKHALNTGKEVKVREQYFTEINNDQTLPTDWLKIVYSILKENSAIYIFIHWSTWSELERSVKEAGFKVKNMIVINKSNHGMGDLKGDYAPKHELVLYATKGRHKLNFPSGRKNNVMDLPVKFSGAHRLHPNEKPVSWADVFILESSKYGDIVLDPFMGSGFVCKSAIKNNRGFIGIENDLTHFDIAKQSLIDFCLQNKLELPFETQ